MGKTITGDWWGLSVIREEEWRAPNFEEPGMGACLWFQILTTQ